MGSWTNPNVQQVTPLAQIGGQSGAGSISLPAVGSTPIITLQDVSLFASYDLNTYIYAASPGVSGSLVTVLIQLVWYDDLVSGIPVFEEDWWVYVGRGAITSGLFSVQSGCGPMHGRYMSVNVVTAASAGGTVQWFNLFGSNRVLPYSDWRQNASAVAPESSGITVIGNSNTITGYDNLLGSLIGYSVVAAARLWLPLNLYAGPVFLRFQASAALNNDPVIATAVNAVSGQIATGNGAPNQVIWNGNNSGTEVETELIFPRAPCYLTLAGLSSGSITVNCEIVAQQAA
jgi:hypothetical protein